MKTAPGFTPSLLLVPALMIGLILGDRLPPETHPIVWWSLPAGLVLLVGSSYFKPACTVYGGVLLFALIGIAETSIFSPRFTTPPVPPFLLDQTRRNLSGIVQQEPEYSGERTRLIVRLTGHHLREQDQAAQGVILLTINGLVTDIGIGDPLRFVARLQPIEGFHNPGGYDFQRVMARQGIRVSGFLDHPDLLIRAGKNQSLWDRVSFRLLRHRVNSLIDSRISPPLSSLASALLTGDQSRIPPKIREAFSRAGVSHLLAFSGLNLALVGGLAYTLIRFFLTLSERALLYLNIRFWAYAGSLLPMAAYAALAGLSPSVARALLMVALVFAALLFRRSSELLNNLAWAALLLLLFFPKMLFQPSFQLSFLSVWAIAYLLPRVWTPADDANPEARAWFLHCRRYLWGSFCISLVTQLATLPAVAWWFYQVSFIGLISNLMLVPLTGALVVPLGLAALLTHPVWPGLATWLFNGTGFLLAWTWEITRFFATLPRAWANVSRPGWPEVILYFLALSIVFNWKGIPRAVWALGLTLTALGVAYFSPQIKTALGLKPLTVTFLDVGHGSATVVELQNGRNLLIDGGGSTQTAFDTGERVVAPFLRQRKISRLEAVVLTHPHPDHLNGLPHILERFPTAAIWLNGDRVETESFLRLEALIREKKIPVRLPRAGWSSQWGEAALSVLHPSPQFLQAHQNESWHSQNNRSLVLKIDCRRRTILLAADIEQEAEAELLERGVLPASDALQVPHHGSRSSSTPAFIEAVSPRWAVVSGRPTKRFPVPHPEVLARYREMGIKVVRTDQEGALRFTLDEDGWTVYGHRRGRIY